MLKVAMVALTSHLLVVATVSGQGPRAAPVTRRFVLVLEGGEGIGGPASSLAAQLREAGFDDPSPIGCFFSCTASRDHPTRKGPGATGGLTVRYAVRPAVSIGVGYGVSELGGSIGWRDNPGTLAEVVFSEWRTKVAWAGAFWTPRPGVRLGGGPAWHRLEDELRSSTISRPGLMAEVGIEAPARRRLFLNLALRGHFVPATDVLPAEPAPTVLRPRWSHLSLLVGLGVRL